MTERRAEAASWGPIEGRTAVRLYGGPWDGKDVWVINPGVPYVRVNGPRHGDHSAWISHLYRRVAGRYEYVETVEDWIGSVG